MSGDNVWPPLGIPSATAHPYNFDGRYGCEVCFAAMHCPHCGDSCGSQGHLIGSDGEWWLSCQDAERTERWRGQFRSVR